MDKLTLSTELWFFNKELGYVGKNTVGANLSNNCLSGRALESLENIGYYEVPEYEQDEGAVIHLKVVRKDIPNDLRGLMLATNREAYNKVLSILEGGTYG